MYVCSLNVHALFDANNTKEKWWLLSQRRRSASQLCSSHCVLDAQRDYTCSPVCSWLPVLKIGNKVMYSRYHPIGLTKLLLCTQDFCEPCLALRDLALCMPNLETLICQMYRLSDVVYEAKRNVGASGSVFVLTRAARSLHTASEEMSLGFCGLAGELEPATIGMLVTFVVQ
jgi:hypothetical protein